MVKGVILYDIKHDTYSTIQHNLLDAEATTEVEKLRRVGLPAFTLVQRQRHNAEPELCLDCDVEVGRIVRSAS